MCRQVQQLPASSVVVAVMRQEVHTKVKQHVQRNATIRRTDAVVCLAEQTVEIIQLQVLAQ